MKIFCILTTFTLALLLFSCDRKKEQILPVDERYLVDAEFEKLLIYIGVDQSKDGKLRRSDIIGVDSLNLFKYSDVKSLRGIEHFENLRSLTIQGIHLDSLDLSKNSKLEYLWCETVGPEGTDASLKFLELTGCKSLRFLKCPSNLLESLDLRQNTKLRELHCPNNLLAELDLSQNTELEILDFGWTNISVLNISSNKKLRSISCPGTAMSRLDLSTQSDLELLNYTATKMSSINITNPEKLEKLYIADSQIHSIDFSKFPNLTSLGVGNSVNNLDLTPLKYLKELDCYGIKATAINLSSNMDLENLSMRLSGFSSLDLSQNINLKNLWLFRMDNLASLDLAGNAQLESFSSIFNYALKTVCVNKLPDAESVKWGKDEWTNFKICK